jgi:hypothetical protein
MGVVPASAPSPTFGLQAVVYDLLRLLSSDLVAHRVRLAYLLDKVRRHPGVCPIYCTLPQLGLGLNPEGGLLVAIVVSFALIQGYQIGNILVTGIVSSVLHSDQIGPSFILSLFGVKKDEAGDE